MIQQLEIHNFQSHENSTLAFGPGVNILVGDTDSGKSAIIRALGWVLTNKPRGQAYRTYDSDKTTVSVLFADGNKVERFVSNQENGYRINEETPLLAIGTGVPEEVERVLNFQPLNLQKQLDSPFLIANTPGDVANHFNKVSNLELIDASRKHIEALYRKTKQDIERHEKQQNEIVDSITSLTYITNADEELIIIETLQEKQKMVEVEIQKQRQLFNDGQVLFIELNNYKWIPAAITDLEVISKMLTEVEEVAQQVAVIFEIQTTKKQLQEQVNTLTYMDKAKSDLQAIENQTEQLSQLVVLTETYTEIMEQYEVIQEELKTIPKSIEAIKTQLPKLCPICQNELKL